MSPIIRVQRISAIGADGKIIHAVLQEQVKDYENDHPFTWVDVRELEIDKDGKTILYSKPQEQEA